MHLEGAVEALQADLQQDRDATLTLTLTLTLILTDLEQERDARRQSEAEHQKRYFALLCLLRSVSGSQRVSSPGHMPEQGSEPEALYRLCHEEVRLLEP